MTSPTEAYGSPPVIDFTSVSSGACVRFTVDGSLSLSEPASLLAATVVVLMTGV